MSEVATDHLPASAAARAARLRFDPEDFFGRQPTPTTSLAFAPATYSSSRTSDQPHWRMDPG